MNQPYLYDRANNVQRHDAEEVIKEYSNILQWRLDGGDTLLDVGTGTGNVLMDFIYTIMPPKFKKVVGSDISSKMMDYAKNCYQSQKKCDFRVLDISTEKDIPNDMLEQFDHVTSFYCLHWIQNQRQALENIYKLLRPEGGDCLLVFLASHIIHDAYKILSQSTEWSLYMKDVDIFVNSSQYSNNPKLDFYTLLKNAGFSDIHVEVRHKFYDYKNLEIFKDNMKAVNPFIKRIPESLHNSFMDDLINAVTTLNLKQNHNLNELNSIFNMPYKLMVAYARKSH